jgi:hypothetical protein
MLNGETGAGSREALCGARSLQRSQLSPPEAAAGGSCWDWTLEGNVTCQNTGAHPHPATSVPGTGRKTTQRHPPTKERPPPATPVTGQSAPSTLCGQKSGDTSQAIFVRRSTQFRLQMKLYFFPQSNILGLKIQIALSWPCSLPFQILSCFTLSSSHQFLDACMKH